MSLYPSYFRMNIVGLIELVASAIGSGVAGTLLTAENILGDHHS